jgi:hypothetical protein
MKKALITGITGQDGSYIAELLLSKGYEVYGLVRRAALENPKHRMGRIWHIKDKINLVPGDIASYGRIIDIFEDIQPDECYHLAAQSFVHESFIEGFSGELLVVFSERLTYNESELLAEIGWHEGGRIRDLKINLGIDESVATGTLAAEKNGTWYAQDEKGIFSFEVPLDKILYPTNRFLRDDLVLIVDTHGVNMLVEQAIRKKVDAVVSDCDYWGKTKAAKRLSDNNISVICFPDRFVYLALGHDLDLVGSPIWRFDGLRMTYGNAPIIFNRGDSIVVSDADFGGVYGLGYYNAPALYFKEIEKTFDLDLHIVKLEDFEELEDVFNEARREGINIVGTRIFSSYDYEQAKEWMQEDDKNRLILFHSTMYPYGIKIMKEFYGRVGFNDPNPVGLD